MTKNLTIKNSTAEFLIFTTQAGTDNINVRIEGETVWLTQKLMAQLFEVKVPTLSEHLKNIFNSNELDKKSVTREFLITATDGKNYNTKHYNLKAVIALGYCINSQKATDFRKWATQVLEQYSVRGYVLEGFGKITATIAKTFAHSKFEKYRPIQDKLFESDFDKEMKKLLEKNNGTD